MRVFLGGLIACRETMAPYENRRHDARLLQGARDRREIGIQGCTKAVHDRDDRKRDARRDQAVFDGGRPGLVGKELENVMLQLRLHFVFGPDVPAPYVYGL